MSQEDILKQILEKLEEIRMQDFMNDSSANISNIQSDVDDIQRDLAAIKKLLEKRG